MFYTNILRCSAFLLKKMLRNKFYFNNDGKNEKKLKQTKKICIYYSLSIKTTF